MDSPTLRAKQFLKLNTNVNGCEYIRLQIQMQDIPTFSILTNHNNSIGQLSKQIRAELALRGLEAQEANATMESKSIFVAAYDKVPTISQLYDASNMALPFSAIVKDLLSFDNVVVPMSFDLETSIDHSDRVLSEFGFILKVEETSQFGSHSMLTPTNERLLSTLNNRVAMQFFNQFCIQEFSIENLLFWVEVQVYKSIRDPQICDAFGNRLLMTYIEPNAPLGLNIEDTVRNNIIESFNTDKRNDLFNEIQEFIYSIIKTHEYVRFEESDYFKKLLEFKTKDRYGYGQGKVEWTVDYLKLQPGFKILQSLPESPPANENNIKKTADSIWGELRVKLLKEIFFNYFPKSEPIPAEYYSLSQREQVRAKQMYIEKQKKLKKFFGQHLNDAQMSRQRQSWHADTRGTKSNSSTPLSPSKMNDSFKDLASSTSDSQDKRKKAEKLTSFFGIPIPNDKIVLEAVEGSKVDQDTLITTLNELDTKEKARLTKRAKKLLVLLGENVEKDVLNRTLTIKTRPEAINSVFESSADSLPIRRDSSMSTIEDKQDIQKRRLDKLSHKFGSRVNEKDIADTTNVTQARKLNAAERKLIQKKSVKLEQLFGTSVPLENLMNYDSQGSVCGSESSSFEDDANDELFGDEDMSPTFESKQSQIARMRKIRKKFGVDSTYSPRDQEPPQVLDRHNSKSSSSIRSPKGQGMDSEFSWKI